MPRILIFNGSPEASQREVSALPLAADNETLFTDALKPFCESLDVFAISVADGEQLPQGVSLDDFDGVTITGSPLNVYKDELPVRRQIELAREIFERGIPTFGSCWGLQLMCAAVGGEVHLNPRGREIGVARTIILNEAGRAHPLYRDKLPAFDALCSHEDEVARLPSCGRLLASNAVSPVQAAELSDGPRSFWGVQYHPEFTFGLLAALVERRAARHISEGLARNMDEVNTIASDYRALHLDPTRRDLAWRYGLGADVLDPLVRRLEFRNWLETKVAPRVAARA
jgi:GMP synthase (glutamine-hydrolysing)